MPLEINAHVDHYSKYNYLEYELFRNNKSIGYHKYNFIRKGSNLSIENEVEFKITKLGIDLYKYYAKGVEKYENGIFSGFNSETNQNKKEKYVNISIDPDDKNLIIDGNTRVIEVNGLHVTPGLISPISNLGIVEINSLDVTRDDESNILSAGFSIFNAFNPNSTGIPWNRSNGVTSAIVLQAHHLFQFLVLGLILFLMGVLKSKVLKI